jgi:uncharacterized membrane protein
MTESSDAARNKPARGQGMTRLEVFTDAAFAFAAAMLAISIDEIPGNYPELLNALKDAPAFAASFAILMLFWRAHQKWSELYGLEDIPAVALTALLILVVMVYVYPLKILFGAGFEELSGGRLQSSFQLQSQTEFRGVLTIYGLGYAALSGLIAALYMHAWRCRNTLELNAAERFDARAEILSWSFVASFGLTSVTLAWLLPDGLVPLAAWMYCLLIPYAPLSDSLQRAAWRRRLLASDTIQS